RPHPSRASRSGRASARAGPGPIAGAGRSWRCLAKGLHCTGRRNGARRSFPAEHMTSRISGHAGRKKGGREGVLYLDTSAWDPLHTPRRRGGRPMRRLHAYLLTAWVGLVPACGGPPTASPARPEKKDDAKVTPAAAPAQDVTTLNARMLCRPI